MKFIDMFCGIGTIRMGFEQAGHECVYSIEWDKWKRKIYSIIFGGEPNGTDIRTIKSIQLPKADCWCFGFPCQDISVAGKQLGFNGDRSSLFFEVMRLLQETKEENKPEYLFVENVKNLFSVNKGWDFFNLLYSLDEGGYDAEWQLLNSKDFGVPQNRERVFIIGHLRGRNTRKVFPIERENPITCNQIGTIEAISGHDILKRCYSFNGLSPTLNTCGGGNTYAKFLVNEVKCLNSKDKNGKQPPQQARVYDTKGIMTALQAEQGGRFNILNNSRIRRLTPKECWRLQGIPDEITDKVIQAGISDTQMYKGAGDATTVNVIYEIAKRM